MNTKKKNAALKVYGVFEIEHTPYGEQVWDGTCYGLFRSKNGAKAYVDKCKQNGENGRRYNFKLPDYEGLKIRLMNVRN